MDLCHDTVSLSLKWIGQNRTFNLSEEFISKYSYDKMDMRERVSPKKSIEFRNEFDPPQYFQLFGKEFVPNLSILDLLFNVGNESSNAIANSYTFVEA